MIDTGSFNGDEVNAFEVNGGAFSVELSATGTIAIGATASAFAPRYIAGIASVAANAILAATRRQRMPAAASLTIGTDVTPTKTTPMGGAAASISIVATVFAHRRQRAAGRSAIAFNGLARLFWQYRRVAPALRQLRLRMDRRLFVVRRHRRDF